MGIDVSAHVVMWCLAGGVLLYAAVWGIGIIDVDGGCIRCRRDGVLMASRRKLLQGVKTLLTMIVSQR